MEKCYAGAIELIGRRMSVDEVFAEVARDIPFYEESTGGMTISGGEPLAQVGFTLRLSATAKEDGLHTCIETSGYSAGGRISAVAEPANAHPRVGEIHVFPYHPLGKSKSEKIGREYGIGDMGFPSDETVAS